MDTNSKYSDLYKSGSNKVQQQRKRRELLLSDQKRQRAELQDNARHIQDFVENLRNNSSTQHQGKNKNRRYRQKNNQAHKLQLSEWLIDKPDHMGEWFLVPCPKGQRCLIVATEGRTEMYSKTGKRIDTFRSMLPGDRLHGHEITILDCVYVADRTTFYVLDVIAFGNQEMTNCDTECRFFWLNSRLKESNLCETDDNNDYSFIPLTTIDCSDMEALSYCFQKYPQWDDNIPELDGFLFYHKNSSYVHGTTPLVGWLFAFMIPEVLGYNVAKEYMTQKPTNYVDYMHHIIIFEEQMKKRKRSRRRPDSQCSEKMDDENESEHSITDIEIMDSSRELELEGRENDPVYN